MVNLHLKSLCAVCSELRFYETICSEDRAATAEVKRPIDERTKEKIEGWLKIAESSANEFEWKAVNDRIKRFRKKIDKYPTWNNLGVEARVLLESIMDGLDWQLMYRYPQDKNDALTNWQTSWAAALRAFPSARQEIVAGVDLWALSHPTPSVSQFMRVLEFGLRVLAAEVGRTFDRQQWHNIIEEIESSIGDIRKTGPRTTEKDERLYWLSQAAKEFFYFKDGWRNYVTHSRAIYDEHQARSVIEHVRVFMNHLATRLSERA